MKYVAITQLVTIDQKVNERRDSLDQRWIKFFHQCNIKTLSIPNNIEVANDFLRSNLIRGIVLTGGNSTTECGGNAPERDEVETTLVEYAILNKIPLLGVCRGMQVIQEFFKVKLVEVQNHVSQLQEITIHGKTRIEVNSYHNYGTKSTVSNLNVWAIADDGVVKGIRHVSLPIVGIMWHPERYSTFQKFDIELVTTLFNSEPTI